MLDRLLVAALIVSSISVVSYSARFLTMGGAVAQFFLGIILLGVGGWQWVVPMLVFFVLSSLLSSLWKTHRMTSELAFEKASKRDQWQVLANGGVGGSVVLLWYFHPTEYWYIAYLGSIAAAAADTWGTEIGTLTGSLARLVTNFKRVPSGTSGGVSLTGSAAGLGGAITIALSGLPWAEGRYLIPFLVSPVIGGVVGSLVDSALGATVQRQNTCPNCGRTVERDSHCGRKTVRSHGIHWINNDVVNLVCTVVGGVAALFCFFVLE